MARMKRTAMVSTCSLSHYRPSVSPYVSSSVYACVSAFVRAELLYARSHDLFWISNKKQDTTYTTQHIYYRSFLSHYPFNRKVKSVRYSSILIMMIMKFSSFALSSSLFLVLLSQSGLSDAQAAPECYNTTTSILLAQLANPPIKDFIICPDTTIQIGLPVNAEFSEFAGGDVPLGVFHDDVTIQCGADGDPSNNCVLTGGYVQLVTVSNNPFLADKKISTNNLKIMGITFSGELTSLPGLASRSIILSAPGTDMMFSNCVFKDLKTDTVVANGRAVLVPDEADYPPFSSSATLENPVFSGVTYGEGLIKNDVQSMTLTNGMFSDITYEDCGCDGVISLIRNLEGIFTLTDTEFGTDTMVQTTVAYWLPSPSNATTASAFTYSGNVNSGAVIEDENEPHCDGGLLKGADVSTGECLDLFVPATDDDSAAPPGVLLGAASTSIIFMMIMMMSSITILAML